MPILEKLQPQAVFAHFEQLCAIPHGSGNTKAISDYLVRFAAARGLRHIQDEYNNVIIFCPGTPGYETAAPVILQGHMDMVCETAPDCAKDMTSEGLDLFVDGDTIGARGTTLGGDDGIAIAMALAILDADDIPHPPLEVVLTVDEETGMLGADALDASVLQGRTMLNIDSEDEGILTVSCAGGNVSVCTLPVTRAAFSGTALTVTVGGLLGGHSGAEIDKGRGNANQLLGRVLYAVGARTALRIVCADGGLKDNAIPRESRAVITVADPRRGAGCDRGHGRGVPARICGRRPGRVRAHRSGAAADAADGRGVHAARRMYALLPAERRSDHESGHSGAGADIAEPRHPDHGRAVRAGVVLRAQQRGHAKKEMLVARLRCLMAQLGGSVDVSGDYPAWEFRKDSPLRERMIDVFREQYGHDPKVEAIHAGVECGLFAGKLPGARLRILRP